MEMNVTSAQQTLSNPSSDIQNILNNASPEAKAALGEAKASLGNGSSNGSRGGEGGETLRVQVVDEEKKFSKELSPAIERWGLLDKGFGYDVVSVFGSQSTGKSTLLNRLFGTSFDVMDEKARKQTTKGIWMCKAKDAPIMVMDVEGTDGRERGEDQDFERKSALFSLAASEILIINLWEHQVGLYQGANMGLLKTVFEVNLGLFGASRGGGKEKTMLMFVIRDHVGATPMSNLEATLTQDMERIWASLSKPEPLQSALLTDYFDLSFTPLPHKLLLPNEFASACTALASRFTDRSNPQYVFQPSYHKRIPADGVAHYMESIWDQVQSNSDLDIPTQQELLAQFRCDEIAGVALELVREGVKGVRRGVEGGKVVEGLGEDMESWRSRALAHFDKDASRYHSGVYHKKRLDLLSITASELSPLFLGQVKNLHKAAVSDFKAELQSTISGGKDYDFAQVVQGAREKWEGWFVEKAKAVLLKDVDWQFEDEYELVKEDLTHLADQLRSDETKKMVKLIERNTKKQLAEPIEFILTQPTPDMWDRVLKEFNSTLEKGETAYLARAKTFATSPQQNASSLESLRLRSWLSLILILRSQTSESVLLSRLRSAFEERFRYGEGGVPRVWKEEDDIDRAFVKGKEETLAILPIYSRIAPLNHSLLPTNIPSSDDPSLLSSFPSSSDPLSNSTAPLDLDEESFSFPSSLSLLSPSRLSSLSASFRREADALFVEAKRSIVSSRASIPVWVYGALVVLGWNEFLAVVMNPLYFTGLLMLGVGAFFVQRFGMAGPLLQIVGTVWGEVHRQVVAKMREAFAPEAQQQHQVSSNGGRREVPAPSSRGGLTSNRSEEIEMKEK